MSKTPSKIKSLAQAHTETALKVLAGIMNQGDCPPAARVTAATALLDRGWGKPTQPVSGDEDAPPIEVKASLGNLSKEQRDQLRGILSTVAGEPESDVAAS